VAIEVKFYTAKRTQVPVGPAKFDMHRRSESPLWGEKPDFWTESKFNTGSLPLRDILPVTRNKSITSKAMQYRQYIVTRMPIRQMELITISIVTAKWYSNSLNCIILVETTHLTEVE